MKVIHYFIVGDDVFFVSRALSITYWAGLASVFDKILSILINAHLCRYPCFFAHSNKQLVISYFLLVIHILKCRDLLFMTKCDCFYSRRISCCAGKIHESLGILALKEKKIYCLTFYYNEEISDVHLKEDYYYRASTFDGC